MPESATSEVKPLTSDPPELETLEIEIDGPIGTMTLNRPDSLNAMSPQMIGELPVAASWLADRAPIRALIVTGAGRAFCSGGDVNWFKQGVDDESVDLPSEVRRGAEVLHQAIIDFRRLPYPTIAAINGPAAGAGMSLALSCDFRIASEDAFLAIAYGRIGASPDGGMTYFLPRVVGPSKALELALNDPNLDARGALDRGPGERGGACRGADAEGAREGGEAGDKGPVLRADGEAAPAREHRELAPDHLQLERHGIADSMATEDLRRGRHRLLRRRAAGVQGRLEI